MKTYVVKALEPVQTDDLSRLDRVVRRRIQKKITQIKSDPYGYGKPLGRALMGLYKARVGKYRIVYQVRKTELLILIIAIAHREEIYALTRERLGR
jgi:mRNA interferase RelE/StbE